MLHGSCRVVLDRSTSELARSTGGPLIHCPTKLVDEAVATSAAHSLSAVRRDGTDDALLETKRNNAEKKVMGTIESNVDKNASKLEDQLKLWSAKLTELAAKVEVAGQEIKIDARKHLDDMKAKIKVAQAKLDEAKAAGGDKWDKFKSSIESSWKELEGAFRKLTH